MTPEPKAPTCHLYTLIDRAKRRHALQCMDQLRDSRTIFKGTLGGGDFSTGRSQPSFDVDISRKSNVTLWFQRSRLSSVADCHGQGVYALLSIPSECMTV